MLTPSPCSPILCKLPLSFSHKTDLFYLPVPHNKSDANHNILCRPSFRYSENQALRLRKTSVCQMVSGIPSGTGVSRSHHRRRHLRWTYGTQRLLLRTGRKTAGRCVILRKHQNPKQHHYRRCFGFSLCKSSYSKSVITRTNCSIANFHSSLEHRNGCLAGFHDDIKHLCQKGIAGSCIYRLLLCRLFLCKDIRCHISQLIKILFLLSSRLETTVSGHNRSLILQEKASLSLR